VNWWKRGALGTMTDESAKKARLMRVMDEMTKELNARAWPRSSPILTSIQGRWPR
jgi:hypothetical protein